MYVHSTGFLAGVENMGGDCDPHWGTLQNFMGGDLSQYMKENEGALNAVEKYLWRSSFDSKVAGYKLASLQI